MARHPEYLWKDPFDPSSSGAVLLSDQIHFLDDEIGLIDPSDEKFLRPAAYDLCVGNAYYEDDIRKDLNDESIEIPPNGLVYVKTREKFNVPYYLVARYSLRVHQVYRGLLIDNGLHIDPGYCGHIWIPVHNFTRQPRVLLQGQEFISVEFNRTTRLPNDMTTIETQDELVSRGIRNELKGSHGRGIKVFYKDLERYKKRNVDFSPRLFWDKFPGEKHQSAMLGTDQKLERVKQDVEETLERRIDSLRNYSLVAFLGLVVAMLAILLPILYGEYGKSREANAQQGADIAALKKRLDAITPVPPTLPSNQAVPRPTPQTPVVVTLEQNNKK